MAIWSFEWGHFGVKFGQFYDNLEVEKRSAKKGDSNGDLSVLMGPFWGPITPIRPILR